MYYCLGTAKRPGHLRTAHSHDTESRPLRRASSVPVGTCMDGAGMWHARAFVERPLPATRVWSWRVSRRRVRQRRVQFSPVEAAGRSAGSDARFTYVNQDRLGVNLACIHTCMYLDAMRYVHTPTRDCCAPRLGCASVAPLCVSLRGRGTTTHARAPPTNTLCVLGPL